MTVSVVASLGERLQGRAAEIAGVLNRAHAQLVELTAELIETEAWADGAGVVSPAHWLVLRAGLSSARARQIVAAAERSVELPTTMAAFASGEISLEQVAPIARHVPGEFEASVLELAKHATVPQIVRVVSGTDFSPVVPFEQRQNDDEPARPEHVEAPSLSMHHRAGRFHLHYQAPSDIGALVEEAVREATDAIWRERNGLTLAGLTAEDDVAPEGAAARAGEHSGRKTGDVVAWTARGDGRGDVARSGPGRDNGTRSGCRPAAAGHTAKVTLADGFAEIASRSMAAVTSTARRERYRVYVHLDTTGGWLTGRPRLPRPILDKLTCDGVLQPVWCTEGAAVNVGRSHRIVPERTRRLLDDRDRGCRYPGCPAVGHTEKHHIVHWLAGGLTDTDNLVSLCSAHHDAHHRGDYLIGGDPDRPDDHRHGLRFTHSAGYRITYRPPPPTPPLTPLPAGTPYAGPTGERMYAHNVVFFPAPHETVST